MSTQAPKLILHNILRHVEFVAHVFTLYTCIKWKHYWATNSITYSTQYYGTVLNITANQVVQYFFQQYCTYCTAQYVRRTVTEMRRDNKNKNGGFVRGGNWNDVRDNSLLQWLHTLRKLRLLFAAIISEMETEIPHGSSILNFWDDPAIRTGLCYRNETARAV